MYIRESVCANVPRASYRIVLLDSVIAVILVKEVLFIISRSNL